ncbi:MAG TPA: hypothetical protein VFV14_10875 [Myxococcaceae bacterium]|nr:hypothetical protein [Myxococcaceae bacterium]
MTPEPSLRGARDRRIAELEARIRRSSAVGVKIPVALTAILLATALLVLERKETDYFFAPSSPLDLGSEGQYRLERLESNRYAQLHGTPTVRGAYWRENKGTFVLVGVLGTPIVVRRKALAGEDWQAGRAPPQPDQRPFAVRGRLLSAQDSPQYRDALAKLASLGELTRPPDGLWLFFEGERPSANLGPVLASAALLIFLLVNAALLWQAIAERREA